MLNHKPSKRLSAKQAANVCQLLLWAPTSWTRTESTTGGKQCPKTPDILQWLLMITTKILYEARFSGERKYGCNNDYQLVATFLSRIDVKEIKIALNWVHENSL